MMSCEYCPESPCPLQGAQSTSSPDHLSLERLVSLLLLEAKLSVASHDQFLLLMMSTPSSSATPVFLTAPTLASWVVMSDGEGTATVSSRALVFL
jgi:hypothetical protein